MASSNEELNKIIHDLEKCTPKESSWAFIQQHIPDLRTALNQLEILLVPQQEVLQSVEDDHDRTDFDTAAKFNLTPLLHTIALFCNRAFMFKESLLVSNMARRVSAIDLGQKEIHNTDYANTWAKSVRMGIQTFLVTKEVTQVKNLGVCLKLTAKEVDMKEIKPFLGDHACWDLGYALLEGGIFIEQVCSLATEVLRGAHDLLEGFDDRKHGYAKQQALANLGISVCSDIEGLPVLQQATTLWEEANWPVEHLEDILDTLKFQTELEIIPQSSSDEACKDIHESVGFLKLLHLCPILQYYNQQLPVGRIMKYLATESFSSKNYTAATVFFQKALEVLGTSSPNRRVTNITHDIYRWLGTTYHNTDDFENAKNTYKSFVDFLTRMYPDEEKHKEDFAECYSMLGFAYSRLGDFTNSLIYYEQAMRLKKYMESEDRKHVESRIGDMYHIKAADLEQKGDIEGARKYYLYAEKAFHIAQTNQQKATFYAHYAYYLMRKGEFRQAFIHLEQSYSLGIGDQSMIMYSKFKEPTLVDCIRQQCKYANEVYVPAPIMAQFLKVVTLMKLGQVTSARDNASRMQKAIDECDFAFYHREYMPHTYPLELFNATSWCLVGYIKLLVGMREEAKDAFRQALVIQDGYQGATVVLEQCSKPEFNAAYDHLVTFKPIQPSCIINANAHFTE